MATTSLDINGSHLVIISTPAQDGLYVELSGADENYRPLGTPKKLLVEQSEKDYHSAIRASAREKGQFVQKYSTDPDW